MATPKSALYWTCASDFDAAKPSVIFLHAAWMSSAMFDETIAHLSPALGNVNLIRVDVNGHGQTKNGRDKFTLWDQGDDVVKLMDELKIEKATVVGISMGACITMALAISHPTRVNALVLIAATGTAATPQQKEAFDQLAQIWTSTPTPSEEILNMSILSWGGNPDLNGVRAKRIKDYWVARHSGAENIVAILESNQERDDVLSRLESVRVPVLMIHGEADATYTLEGAKLIRDHLVNATVKWEVIKDGCHLVIGMRDSEDVSKLIEDFVKEVAVAA